MAQSAEPQKYPSAARGTGMELGSLVGNLAERKQEGREMCWTIVWHFKQNPDALMCFFPHKCWVRQIGSLTGVTPLLVPVVSSALTPSCCSHVPSDCSEEQETFFLHPKGMFIGAGTAGPKLRDTKWSQIGASVAPSLFSQADGSRLGSHRAFAPCPGAVEPQSCVGHGW